MCIRSLYPDRIEKSVLEMDWDKLSETYEGVIFDIDNTLVPHGAAADETVMGLFQRLHSLGMKTMLVSNNGEERVRPFAQAVGSGFVCKAGKPKIGGYQRAMKEIATDAGNTLFVGDQIFTDILGANRAGITAILVEPVDPSTDEIQIMLKRMLEKPFRRAVRHERIGVSH